MTQGFLANLQYKANDLIVKITELSKNTDLCTTMEIRQL